jgi:glycosyltransferase involved in cell wall biosynthesis
MKYGDRSKFEHDSLSGPKPSAADSAVRGTIGVVIPCHNYGRFLREAFDSLQAQTRSPDEIVIVDDGSTDETDSVIAQILLEYPGVKAISRRPAQGATQTFNDGIRSTNTDFVMLLSADDRMSQTYLEESAAVLDSGADVAVSEVRLFGTKTECHLPARWSLDGLLLHNEHHGSMLYRRRLFDAVGGYGDYRREDWAFWIAAAAKGAVGKETHECYLDYRQHGPSRVAMTVSQSRLDRARIWWAMRREVGYIRLVRALARLGYAKARRK